MKDLVESNISRGFQHDFMDTLSPAYEEEAEQEDTYDEWELEYDL